MVLKLVVLPLQLLALLGLLTTVSDGAITKPIIVPIFQTLIEQIKRQPLRVKKTKPNDSDTRFNNFPMVDALQTPEHIRPKWYFIASYSVLRVVSDTTLGVVNMFTFFSVVIYFLCVSLFLIMRKLLISRDTVALGRHRSSYVLWLLFFVGCGVLHVLGSSTPTESVLLAAKIFASLTYCVIFIFPFTLYKYSVK